MGLVRRTCERDDCEHTGPLVDITTTPVEPCEWRRDAPEDPRPAVWVCEAHAEEFNRRVSVEARLTPTAFVAEGKGRTWRGRAAAVLGSVVPRRRAH